MLTQTVLIQNSLLTELQKRVKSFKKKIIIWVHTYTVGLIIQDYQECRSSDIFKIHQNPLLKLNTFHLMAVWEAKNSLFKVHALMALQGTKQHILYDIQWK